MKIALFFITLLISSLANAATAIDGWYTSVFGGYTGLLDDLSITRNGLARNYARFESGYNVGGRFGYQYNPLRLEGELTYLQADLEGFRVNSRSQHGITGDTNAWLAMANVYYDFPDMVLAVRPFLGLGLGGAWVRGSFDSRGPFVVTQFHDTDKVFAFQATGGFTYNFSENYAVNIAYRYVGTDTLNLGKMLQANLGTVGIIYRFNEVAYK
jgi:opacity protein-like surface antigen